jgi:competence protein ComGC
MPIPIISKLVTDSFGMIAIIICIVFFIVLDMIILPNMTRFTNEKRETTKKHTRMVKNSATISIRWNNRHNKKKEKKKFISSLLLYFNLN